MKKVQDYLTKKEARILCSQPDQRTLQGHRDWCILKLMLLTGARRQEVCDISRGSFIKQDNMDILYIMGKGSMERRIRVDDTGFLQSLRRYWKRAEIPDKPRAPVFMTLRHSEENPRHRITPRVVQHVVKKYTEMAGIEKSIHPHSLRRSFANARYEEHGDLALLQLELGHANISTTRIYLNIDEKRSFKSLEGFSLGS